MSFERGRTSKGFLKLDWTFPAVLDVQPDTAPKGGTTTAPRMVALDRSVAFTKIAGEDLRPLLILRECGHCKGTEDALLSRKLDNERTQLMAAWFHCVKFKPNVLEENHTFRKIFGEESPAHLVLCSPDGSNLVRFDGAQSQGDLLDAMQSLMAIHYEKSPEASIKRLQRLLEKYDQQDAAEAQAAEKLDMEFESEQPSKRAIAKWKKRLEQLEKDRKRLDEERAKLLDLGLHKIEVEPAKG
ncbi:MAG: hypothetical protein H6834_17110 [Planctomycetes bacterium]|nr:hypothetical protein [Planctomycetota bacterium]MCB9892505.1 hypothetical protein [Planctomycetota bacterium]